MAKTIVALYDSFAHAEAAVNDVIRAGFPSESVSILANNTSGRLGESTQTLDSAENPGNGTNWAHYTGPSSLAMAFVIGDAPGIGPVAVVGPLSTILNHVNADPAPGAMSGLNGMGIPDAEAGCYAEGVRRGGTLVTVRSSDDRAIEARDVLNRYYPAEMRERTDYYIATGYVQFDAARPALTPEQIEVDRTNLTTYKNRFNTPLTTTEATFEPAPRATIPGLTDSGPHMETILDLADESDDNSVFAHQGTQESVPAGSGTR